MARHFLSQSKTQIVLWPLSLFCFLIFCCFFEQMEFRMARHFLSQPDFFEGVRASLIDKDRNPKWQVCCSVLQYVLQYVLQCVLQGIVTPNGRYVASFKCVAVYRSVLQLNKCNLKWQVCCKCVAVCCSLCVSEGVCKGVREGVREGVRANHIAA